MFNMNVLARTVCSAPFRDEKCIEKARKQGKAVAGLISAAYIWLGSANFSSAARYEPVLASEREAFSARASKALQLLQQGRQFQAQGNFLSALQSFNEVIEKAGDLALAEYARVGHAVSLYELGNRSDAIIEMEDVSISLKGYPEVHAALAAALYAELAAALYADNSISRKAVYDRNSIRSSLHRHRVWKANKTLASKPCTFLTKFINLE